MREKETDPKQTFDGIIKWVGVILGAASFIAQFFGPFSERLRKVETDVSLIQCKLKMDPKCKGD